MKFPVNFPVSREFGAETGSQSTASSTPALNEISWRSPNTREAFCLWHPKTVSRRAGRPETRFACDRDRFACKDFERNWDTMVSSEL